jgi:DNA modification methylase
MILLMQGDALEQMDLLIENGVVVDAIITDPPYGTTACKWDAVIPFEPMWERLNKLIKPNGAIVLFGSEPFSSALRMSNIKNYKYDWVWEKNTQTNGMNAKKQPLFNYEIISVFYKKLPLYNPQMTKGKPYKIKRNKPSIDSVYGKTGTKNGHISVNNGERYPKRIIKFNVERGQHPTQKPVALMEYLIKTYTTEGEIVLDFTMGSGSTGVAARNLNRRFVGIERDPEYFKIASDRIYS